jgi:hypothetical protein
MWNSKGQENFLVPCFLAKGSSIATWRGFAPEFGSKQSAAKTRQ